MLLRNKVALIYGAGGSVGGAVSRAFARHGAHVVLCGRSRPALEAALVDIRGHGGNGEVALVDVMQRDEVEALVAEVHRQQSRIDISFNLVGLEDVQGLPLQQLALDDFLRPIDRAMRSYFITATAAAASMTAGGVILALTANCGKKPFPNTGGFGVACAAIAGLSRQLAVELGPRGIRTACLMSAGSPDSAGVSAVFDAHAARAGVDRATFDKQMAADTMLGHLPSLSEVSDVAVLFASDQARAMTAAIANVTCGEIVD